MSWYREKLTHPLLCMILEYSPSFRCLSFKHIPLKFYLILNFSHICYHFQFHTELIRFDKLNKKSFIPLKYALHFFLLFFLLRIISSARLGVGHQGPVIIQLQSPLVQVSVSILFISAESYYRESHITHYDDQEQVPC